MPNDIEGYNIIEKIRERQSETYEKYLPKAINQIEKLIFEAVDKGFDSISIPNEGRMNDSISYSELNSEINCIQKVLRVNKNEFKNAVATYFELNKNHLYIKEQDFGPRNNFYLVIDWRSVNAE